MRNKFKQFLNLFYCADGIEEFHCAVVWCQGEDRFQWLLSTHARASAEWHAGWPPPQASVWQMNGGGCGEKSLSLCRRLRPDGEL